MGATNTGAVDGAVKDIQSKSAANSGLSGSVGFKGANAPDDVWKVSSALHANGLMEAPQSHADNALFTGITKAQESMDSSLKKDGLVNPGGPTESTYTRYVGQGFMKAPSTGDMKAPSSSANPAQPGTQGGDFSDPLVQRKPAEPGTGGLYAPGTAKDVLRRDHAKQEAVDQQARLQRQAERRQERGQAEAAKRAMAAQQAPGLNSGLSTSVKPETVKKAVEGLGELANKAVSALTGEGGATASSNATKRPALSDEAYASNRRTADALGKYKGVGDLPRFTTDAINTNGEKAVHEVADLIGQVHGRDQEQAKELFDKTAQGIAPENRALLKQAMDGHIADQNKAVVPSASQLAGSPSGIFTDEAFFAPPEYPKAGNFGSRGSLGEAGEAGILSGSQGQANTEVAQATPAPSQTPQPSGNPSSSGQAQAPTYPSLFQTFRKNLATWEGGLANRPKSADPGGLTQKGMSQKELDKLKATGRWPNLPAKSDQLSDQQIDEIFYKEYFDRPHLDRLANLPGLSTAAPKLTEQVFDSGFQHGVTDAGRWLQESLDEALGTDLRVPDKNGSLNYDGIVGPATRQAVEQAVKTGQIKAVNNRIVDKRVAYMKTLPEYQHNPGWIPRAESFRMP